MMAAACAAKSVEVTALDADLPDEADGSCRISLPLKKG